MEQRFSEVQVWVVYGVVTQTLEPVQDFEWESGLVFVPSKLRPLPVAAGAMSSNNVFEFWIPQTIWLQGCQK